MTIPATLSITVTVVGLLFALLTFGLSRGPGWRELRYFAALALCAALYTLTNAPVTITSLPPALVTWASRVGLFWASLHGCFWYAYNAAQEGRVLHRWERVVVTTGALLAISAVVPRLVIGDSIDVRYIAWLGASYHDPVPTTFGAFCFAFDIVALMPLLVGYVKKSRAGVRGAAVHVVGLGALASAAAYDSTVASLQLEAPYLLDVGFLALLVSIGTSIARGFVRSARALQASSIRLRRAQDRLVKRERLAALGELSAVVAHEVRNPLGVIFNALASLKRLPPSSTDHAELLRIVQEEAERLKRMVADLLEFARPRELHLGPVSVFHLLTGATEAARNAVGEPASSVEIDVEDDLPTLVCDEQLLRQAVINLVTNAILAPERKTPVQVRATLGGEDRDEIMIEVEDDGAGVPSDVAPHIFTPFFTTRATGTGLGLSVVQRIAEAHGGEAALAPHAGRGALFVLRVPLHPRPNAVSLSDSAELRGEARSEA